VKRALLRPILTGEHTWCQLFSEPGSGSDLAGLTTRAELDGDEWVVNGQKLWSTSAHHADFAILLARTDWDVPKHKGITYFVLPMHQPGVEPRPLRQMNFHASFNEVFISDARIPAAFVVGAPGEGWRAAMTTLAFERRLGAVRRPHVDRNGGRALREYEVEAEEYFATYRWYPQRAGRADLTVGIATANGTKGDPVVRQRLAGLFALQRSHQLNAQRAEAARAQGRSPAAYGSLGKLGLSAVARAAAAVHSTLAGATGMLAGTALAEAAFAVGSNTAATHPIVAEVLISVPAQSIAGGTDEIQHNIIGEQLLGLPRDPVVDRDLPFRQTRGSPAGRHGKPIAGHQG
jgi:alkylation response protein AidB-like acyl-CoA dehydrogenase